MMKEGGGGGGGGQVLPVKSYTGRCGPKGVPFLGFRYIKGLGFYKVKFMNW